MSLILEALKKLEREKSQPEDRGFLVLGAQPGRPRRRAGAVVGGLTAVAAVVGVALWLGRSTPAPSAPQVTAGPGRTPDAASPAAAPSPTPAVEGVDRASAGDATPPAPEKATEPGPAVADPRPEPSPRALGPPFRLEAISRRDGQPVAILNGRLVREGDRLGNARVVRIGELEVEIEVDGTRSVLAF